MKIAIIPARGGSKRIPRKNIKLFHGRPIISFAIETAIKSNCFDRILVSTDDEEVASVAVASGAEVPFLRPARLADDRTPTVPVIAHVLESISMDKDVVVDHACCLYPTAVLLTSSDLQRGFEVLLESGAEYSVSVVEYNAPIQRALQVADNNFVNFVNPDIAYCRTQDLPRLYHDAGAFYWGRSDAWLSGRPIFSDCTAPVILPRTSVQDIDEMEDWLLAEALYQVKMKQDGDA